MTAFGVEGGKTPFPPHPIFRKNVEHHLVTVASFLLLCYFCARIPDINREIRRLHGLSDLFGNGRLYLTLVWTRHLQHGEIAPHSPS